MRLIFPRLSCRSFRRFGGWLALIVVLACRAGLAGSREVATEDADTAVSPSLPSEWAQWRGPRRDGVCRETGLLQSWPAGGPPVVWSVEGMGRGYSAPIVAGERIFLTGDFEERLEILALNLEGEVLWRATNGLAWRREYPGSRSSCTLSNGRLFHKNAHGRVACYDPASGRELWARETLAAYEARNITWGLSESLLVEGGRVFVTVGGAKALMVALNVDSGEVVWASAPLLLGPSEKATQERLATPQGEADSAGYTSPILVSLAGRKQLVQCSLRHLFGMDAESGQLLWTRPFPTRYSVIAATPVAFGDTVLVTAPDAGGGQIFRITQADPEGVKVDRLARTDLDTGQGGVLERDGLFYGAFYRGRRGWAAVDARSGALRHEIADMPMGPVLYADGRLYWLSQEGEMTLVTTAAAGFHIESRFRLVPGRVTDAWAHPVICEGRLYLRYHDRLSCYDVRDPRRSTSRASREGG